MTPDRLAELILIASTPKRAARFASLAEDMSITIPEAIGRVIDAGIAEMSRRTPTVSSVLADVVAETGVSLADILGPSRLRHTVIARHEVMIRLRNNGFSLPEIGRATNRDHTSVLHAVRKAGR